MPRNLSTTTLRVAAVAVAILWVAAVLILSGCSTIARPDLGIKRSGGQTYRAEQPTIFGKPVASPRWVPTVTATDKLKNQLSAPAEFLLWITIPSAILSAAGFVYMLFFTGNPRTMKRLGIIAAISGTAAVFCAAWMLTVIWILFIVPALIIVLVIGYKITHGKKLAWSTKGK